MQVDNRKKERNKNIHVDGKLYVVDGQQRLTTLTLILIKLKHFAKHYGSQLEGWVAQKIVGLSDYKTDFWMNHEVHKASMQGLFDGLPADKLKTDSGLTAQNMVSNYSVVSSRLDSELTDVHRFESFVFYENSQNSRKEISTKQLHILHKPLF